MSEEYDLSFLEAMKALCEGKDVKNELYAWVYYNPKDPKDDPVDQPFFEGFLGRVTRAVFTEKEQKAKWRVVE